MPLTIMHARVIGLMTMIDSGDPDHKMIAVATSDPEYSEYHEVNELPPHQMADDSPFFSGLQAVGREGSGRGRHSAAGEGVPNHQECPCHLQETISARPCRKKQIIGALTLPFIRRTIRRGSFRIPLADRHNFPPVIAKRPSNPSRNRVPRAAGVSRKPSSVLKRCNIVVIHEEKR